MAEQDPNRQTEPAPQEPTPSSRAEARDELADEHLGQVAGGLRGAEPEEEEEVPQI